MSGVNNMSDWEEAFEANREHINRVQIQTGGKQMGRSFEAEKFERAIEQAKLISDLFDICKQIDLDMLQEIIDQSRRHETVGMFTRAPFEYLLAVEKNRAANDKTQAVINLVKIIKEEK